jgi:hypothetical protein
MFNNHKFIKHLCSIQVPKIIASYTFFLFGVLVNVQSEFSNTGNAILEGNQPNQFMINQELILVLSIFIILTNLILIFVNKQKLIEYKIYFDKYILESLMFIFKCYLQIIIVIFFYVFSYILNYNKQNNLLEVYKLNSLNMFKIK